MTRKATPRKPPAKRSPSRRRAFRPPLVPGEVYPAPGEIVANADRAAVEISVTNDGDRPVQVGSHYHFFEVNSALTFDRNLARGMRLDIPAGTAVRFEPGQKKTISLISLAGLREVWGFNARVEGPLDTRRRKPVAAGKTRGARR